LEKVVHLDIWVHSPTDTIIIGFLYTVNPEGLFPIIEPCIRTVWVRLDCIGLYSYLDAIPSIILEWNLRKTVLITEVTPWGDLIGMIIVKEWFFGTFGPTRIRNA
jgi:hypothetical protein